MVIASIRNIRYFLLILVIFVLGFGSTFFVLLHQGKGDAVAVESLNFNFAYSFAEHTVLKTLKDVARLLVGNLNEEL